MKSMTKLLLISAVCSCVLIKSSDNNRCLEVFTLDKTPRERWVARHWRETSGQHAYLTTCSREIQTRGIGGYIFDFLLSNMDIKFFYTEEKFREIKQACQSYELQSVASEQKENHN